MDDVQVTVKLYVPDNFHATLGHIVQDIALEGLSDHMGQSQVEELFDALGKAVDTDQLGRALFSHGLEVDVEYID